MKDIILVDCFTSLLYFEDETHSSGKHHWVKTHISVSGFLPFRWRVHKTTARKPENPIGNISNFKYLLTGHNPCLRSFFANGTRSGRIGVIQIRAKRQYSLAIRCCFRACFYSFARLHAIERFVIIMSSSENVNYWDVGVRVVRNFIGFDLR